MPNDPKPTVSSLTILGIFFSVFSGLFPSLAAFLHLTDPATQQQIITVAGQIGAVVFGLVAVYGRITASAPISGFLKTAASRVAMPSAAQVETAGATIIADLAATPKPPGATASALLAFLVLGAIVLAPALLTACASTAAVTASSVQLDEGKALDTIVTASDALAVSLDAAAKSGAITGASATTARNALMSLQTGLAAAQTAYAAQDGTQAQKIAALATLLDDCEQALPLSASTSAEVDAAISAAVAIANTY